MRRAEDCRNVGGDGPRSQRSTARSALVRTPPPSRRTPENESAVRAWQPNPLALHPASLNIVDGVE
eukprot:5834290-Pleurochrysis_carterae.AAC.1